MRLLAIDPGDVHCGMALFHGDRGCQQAWELDPPGCLRYVRGSLEDGELDVLIIEKFVLYPWKAQEQAYSQMLTCQLIGALKAAWAWWGGECELVEQGATIKKPTVGVLRSRKVASKAKQSKAGGHAFDAELHGYYYLLKGKDQT